MIQHKIGCLVNDSTEFKKKCAQIYIMDGHLQEKLRSNYSPTLQFIILQKLRFMMDENPFVSQFKMARDLLKTNPLIDFKISIVTESSNDKRRYNQPTVAEIAIIMPDPVTGESIQRKGIAFNKNGFVQKVDVNQSSYIPLAYPLMFPSGQLAWQYNTYKLNLPNKETSNVIDKVAEVELNIADEGFEIDQFDANRADDYIDAEVDEPEYQEDELCESEQPENVAAEIPVKKMEFISAMQYYAYLLYDRPNSYLHSFGRLFLQFICDTYSIVELNRLKFLRNNQETLRADKYQNIKNSELTNLGYTIGKRTVLPSTYKGSPRNLMKLFQDSMAVVREYGKPDLFVTVTCNSKWPEITQELKHVAHEHKLTLINRVFKLKLKAIMDDIYAKKIFGNVEANMYVIEFQKRGLPHAHILIIMKDDSKPRNTEDYDRIVSAEIPDIKKHPQAYETVTSLMIHGPCGKLNPLAQCMDPETGTKFIYIQNHQNIIIISNFIFYYFA